MAQQPHPYAFCHIHTQPNPSIAAALDRPYYYYEYITGKNRQTIYCIFFAYAKLITSLPRTGDRKYLKKSLKSKLKQELLKLCENNLLKIIT